MLNNKISISIITPFYNSKKLINNHLQKIKKLIKHLPSEVIYIDDGSKDSGFNYLRKKILNYNDIKIIKLKKNSGPGIARNIGIKKAKGKYILFLDIDDFLICRGFINLINKIKKSFNYDLIFFDYVKKGNQQINLSKIFFNKNKLIKKFLRTDLDMCPNFYLYKKEFIIENKIFFKKGFYEDILFVFKVFVNIKKIKQIKEKVYRKNQYYRSITSSYSDKHIYDFMKTSFEKYKFFYKKSLNKFNDVYISDLQYGLRGDYIFANKILANCKNPKINVKVIDKLYKKLINEKFNPLTIYDKIVKKSLFLNK